MITFDEVIDARQEWTYKGDMQRPTLVTRDPLAILAGFLIPPATCAGLIPVRGSFPNTDAALVLVAAIVAVAAFGNRTAGVVAAISSGAWFDFFLTKPYEHFSITSRTDIETTVLLFAVGIAVTELAVWGRRQHHRAGQQSGYLAGLHAASEAMARGGSPTQLVRQVADEIARVLDLQRCHFDFGSSVGLPKLNHDGTLTWGDARWDIETQGLPLNDETELLVSSGSGYKGRYLMTPTPGARPTLTQRLVAVSLADQVGAALGEYDPSHN
jgi:K+-sensing histidine kinase KdpD